MSNHPPVNDFLVEIGTEELPPKALKHLLKSFSSTLYRELDAAGLAHNRAGARIYASPRRLAVLLSDLVAAQADRAVEKQGPFIAQAFGADGKPSPAALGFAKSNGVTLEQLERVPSEKGERLVFRATEKGRSAVELLPTLVEKALQELPIPKRMRWGARRAEFVRPVHWLVMLYGSEVIDCEILEQKAGRNTRGHRFHASGELTLAQPSDYSAVLRNHFVEPCFKVRRDKIVAQVEKLAESLGGKAVIERDLLDEVTALVEWPVALAGKFEERFLQVPQEALISSMSEHQKYFHVVDANGKLLPYFITVSNIESTAPEKVIDGNERVIRPRLSDAAFFFNTDLKTPLADRREKLKTIVFQAELGTLFDKSERVAKLAAYIAEKIGGNVAWAQRAGTLSKCDLVSNMVQEFDTMQGIAGSYYAQHDGESAEVAAAMQEQYLPKFAGDAVPQTLTGCALALADRLDTLVGIFGIGQIPSGSKDPFALRRASIGVLQILLQRGLDVDLRDVIAAAHSNFSVSLKNADVKNQVLDYIIERMRALCLDDNISAETFNAVAAKQLSVPLDIQQRALAVHHFAQLPEAASLAAANKRVSNILSKSAVEMTVPSAVDTALLQEADEKTLAAALAEKQQQVSPLLAQRDYSGTLSALASLREPVDAFFDGVMVMADDAALRNNRLALLAQLRALFLQVADISQLVPDKK
jgi:glycyl-tRNA synthetase beta chain